MERLRRSNILGFALVFALSACGTETTDPDDNGGNNGGTPSITLSLSTGTLTIAQGASGTATATVGRAGGFTGSVSIEVTGMPSGMTASPSPASIGSGSTSSTISVSVGASVAAGSYNLSVRASGTGVSAVTQTLQVTVTAVATGSFSLGISPTSGSVMQGQQTTATVSITRSGGFSGSVDLTVSGAPAGLTASLSPASTTGNSSSLTMSAGASLAAGTYNLTVMGNATGLTQQAVSFALTVTATGGGGGNTTWTYCTNQVPLWFAYQDGTGAWTQVQPNGGTFSFDISSGRGGVAVVSAANQLEVFYGTQAELNLYGARCGSSSSTATKTINGTVAGLGATDQGFVSFGGGFAALTFGQSAFTLQNVYDGTFDLVASRSSLIVQGSSVSTQMTAGIIRRSLNPADNSTLPVLDFNGAEAWTPDQRTLTINNAGTDQTLVSSFFITGNGGAASLYTEIGLGGGTTRPFYSVPNSVRQSGDLQFVQVNALANMSALNFRQTTVYSASSADVTVPLGPSITGVSVNVAGINGYARLGATYTVQSEYDDLMVLQGSQLSGRVFQIYVTKGHLNGATTFNYSIPDFSGTGGWMNTWAPQAGAQVAWTFFAMGYSTGGGFFTPLQDGVVAQAAYTGGNITP